MEYLVLLRRLALVATAMAVLSSCVGTQERHRPSGRHADPRPGDRLEGRVDGRQLIGRVGALPDDRLSPRTAKTMAAETEPLDVADVGEGVAATGTADGPDGDGLRAESGPVAGSGATEAGGRLVIPPDGVNIDAELGVAGADAGAGDNPLGVGETGTRTAAPVAAQILVPQGPMAIAEGQTSQPVVDDIGTDNPVSLQAPQGQGADPAL